MKQSKIVKWYCLLAAASIIFLIYINTTYKNTQIDTFNYKKVISLKEGWKFINEQGKIETVHLPMKKKITAGQTYTLVNTLPMNYEEGSVLCFKSNHLLIKAYIQNQLVYSYTIDDRNTIGKSPGCSFCFIPVPLNSYGKEIKIEYTTVYENASNHISGIYFGEKSLLITALIRKNLISIILCALIFLIGILFITIYFIKSKTKFISKSLLYLGIMAIPFSIWSVTETQVLQFFIPNSYVIQYITYLSLGFISIPFLLYSSELYYQSTSVLVKALNGFALLSTTAGLALQIFGWRDLPEFTWIIHGNLLIAAGYSICYTIKEDIWLFRQNRKKLLLPNLSMLIILFCGSVDLLRFYLKEKEDYSKFVRIGFIIYLACVGIKSMIQTSELEKENQYLENLAFMDSLSGLSNQTAYIQKCKQIEDKITTGKIYGILKFRIQRLAEIEDKYGSRAKEELIITSSRLVQHAFSKHGNCYRIRENEFAVILEKDVQNAYKLGEKNFKQRLKNCNLSRAEKLELVMEFEEKTVD